MRDVKICGLTNRDDAMRALELGADYIGFVLYRESPRGITGLRLAKILDRMDGVWRAVGVFVNESPATVLAIAGDCGLAVAQIHGDEEAAPFEDVSVPLWRAVRLRDGVAEPSPDAWAADRYVIDAAVPGLYGGSGVAADWEAAARFAGERPTMLAGGLTAENVAEGIRQVKPLGVDVASGVEAAPGRKDPDKLRRFIENARRAGEDMREAPSAENGAEP